ncbi:MAG TPA: NAD(P)H-dependent glycerol-3-phosphate dehydrogenase [Armatimonadota bacterium]|nr:NAD(P)H-dependent glycerol-3-phosphate dehydrogenase [Armatimonadota bacterium]
MHRIAVLGAGSWGTALSLLLARKGCDICLWVWDPDQAKVLLESRVNPFLPGFQVPEDFRITASIPEAVQGADGLLLATPSDGIPDLAKQLKACLPPGIPIISGTKGLNSKTGLTVSQILGSVLSGANLIGALSGPNLAVELAKGIPTATVIACSDYALAHEAQTLFMCPSLRVYTNRDVIGVELAGALKNVIAIAAGICDGLGYGDNTKAALVTRGLAEITRLATKIGAEQATFMGLAGVGDLMATCASPLSRNRRLGLGLAKGGARDDIMREIGQVAEGIPTTRAAYDLARKHETPMPITEEVYQVLFEGKPPQAAVADLMTREPKEEVW